MHTYTATRHEFFEIHIMKKFKCCTLAEITLYLYNILISLHSKHLVYNITHSENTEYHILYFTSVQSDLMQHTQVL